MADEVENIEAFLQIGLEPRISKVGLFLSFFLMLSSSLDLDVLQDIPPP